MTKKDETTTDVVARWMFGILLAVIAAIVISTIGYAMNGGGW